MSPIIGSSSAITIRLDDPKPLGNMNLSLNRRLNRRLNCYTTTLAPGARRPNWMTEVSKVFREYFRWRKRFAKLMPDFFDYAGAERRAREESDRRQLEIELNNALNKVYGPLSSPDQLPATRSTNSQIVSPPGLR